MRINAQGWCAGGLFLLLAGNASGNTFFLPRTVHDLQEKRDGAFQVEQDRMVRVKGAEVAFVNFDALRRDCPEELKGKTDDEIKHWVLHQFGFVAERQLKLAGIRNEHFEIEDPANPQ